MGELRKHRQPAHGQKRNRKKIKNMFFTDVNSSANHENRVTLAVSCRFFFPPPPPPPRGSRPMAHVCTTRGSWLQHTLQQTRSSNRPRLPPPPPPLTPTRPPVCTVPAIRTDRTLDIHSAAAIQHTRTHSLTTTARHRYTLAFLHFPRAQTSTPLLSFLPPSLCRLPPQSLPP